MLKIVSYGGELEVDDSCCCFRDSDECLVLAGVFSTSESGGMAELCSHLEATGTDWSSLLADHECVHASLYRRVVFSLSGGEEKFSRQTDREVLAEAYAFGSENVLIEKMFNYSRYCFISSSGKMPPNLQMNIRQALAAGLPEFYHSYFDYPEKQFPDWRENARSLYNAADMVAPVNSTTHGCSLACYLHIPGTSGSPGRVG